MYCPNCGKEIEKDATFCPHCGYGSVLKKDFIMVTTPTISGYKITRVLGVVTGLTPRTRGVLGKFVASFKSMIGGEVTAFTTELEKARMEAMDRVREKAIALGANALAGLDLETSGSWLAGWNYGDISDRHGSCRGARMIFLGINVESRLRLSSLH